MIESLIGFLQANILPLGALGVFLASVIEEVIAPIPSALILTMSGFLFVSGDFSSATLSSLVLKVALPGALGVAIGSLVLFYVAWFGGKPVIQRFGKWVGLSWDDVEKLNTRLSVSRKDEVLVMIGRILPVVPSTPICVFCGLVRMNVWKYLVLTFAGVFLRAIILGAVGWQVGNVYMKYAGFVSSIENVVLIFTIFVCIVFIVLKYKSK